MIFVECSNPECDFKVGINPHVEADGAAAYCSLTCWKEHHEAVAVIRDAQRREAIERGD
jgi:hypothetical protein